MARLYQTRSSPLTRVSRSSKRGHKNKICLRKYAQSTGNLEIRPKGGLHHKSSHGKNLENVNESTQLMEQNYQPPKERWIALGLFCALASAQCCIWNTWGPIASSAMKAFPTWRRRLVALLSNWGCITYLTCCFPCCWLVYRKGLSAPLRMAAILSGIATFVRCLSPKETVFTVLAHMAAILNGLSGVIIGPTTALLSAVWFPSGERTTATGISSACNQLGMAVSYLIGPAVLASSSVSNNSVTKRSVSSFGERNSVQEDVVHSKKYLSSMSDIAMAANGTLDQMELRVQIMSLMRIEFVVQFFVLLGVLCFFPKEPCYSVEASEVPRRFGLVESIAYLSKSTNMWKLCLAAALSQGVTGPWLAMITMTFGSLITQAEADKLAFWTIISSSVVSLVASRLTDMYQGHLKVALYVLLMTSASMFLWVLLLDNRILVFHKEELYAAVVFGISASWSTPALFLELASEIAFPVSEAIVGGYMIFLSNLIGTLFYFSYFVSGIGEHWSSCCVFGNLTTATVLVIYVKEEYNRTERESQMELKIHRCADNPRSRKNTRPRQLRNLK